MTAIRPGASPESVADVAGDLTAHTTAAADAHDVSAITDALRLERTDLGGQVPLTPRVPTLAVDAVFPGEGTPYVPIWGRGMEAYATADDRRLRLTLDGGTISWMDRSATSATPSFRPAHRGCFLKLATDTLLTVEGSVPPKIHRSTDGGATWVQVHLWRTGTEPLVSQSWCVDEATGYIYYGEYAQGDALSEIRVYRSTDDGQTFTVFHEFPGPVTTDALRVRHVHAVQYDPVGQRVYVSCGDTQPGGGIWRVNDSGDALEPFVLNADGDAAFVYGKSIYPIGMMFFDDYIAWGGDNVSSTYLYRAHRTTKALEQVYRLSGSSWGTARAQSDNSVWLMTTSQEGGLDSCAHIFAVQDNGASIYEVGAVPTLNRTFAAIMPAGPAEQHGENGIIWLTTRDFAGTDWSARVTYSRSTLPLIKPPARTRHFGLRTVSSGQVALASGETHIFGATRCPTVVKRFLQMEACAHRISGIGQVRCGAYRRDTNALLHSVTTTSTGPTVRSTNASGFGEYLAADYRSAAYLPENTLVEFVLEETSGSATDLVVSGYYVFGWGP